MYAVGDKVKATKDLKPTKTVTIPKGAVGTITKVITRISNLKAKYPYDVDFAGYFDNFPAMESEVKKI